MKRRGSSKKGDGNEVPTTCVVSSNFPDTSAVVLEQIPCTGLHNILCPNMSSSPRGQEVGAGAVAGNVMAPGTATEVFGLRASPPWATQQFGESANPSYSGLIPQGMGIRPMYTLNSPASRCANTMPHYMGGPLQGQSRWQAVLQDTDGPSPLTDVEVLDETLTPEQRKNRKIQLNFLQEMKQRSFAEYQYADQNKMMLDRQQDMGAVPDEMLYHSQTLTPHQMLEPYLHFYIPSQQHQSLNNPGPNIDLSLQNPPSEFTQTAEQSMLSLHPASMTLLPTSHLLLPMNSGLLPSDDISQQFLNPPYPQFGLPSPGSTFLAGSNHLNLTPSYFPQQMDVPFGPGSNNNTLITTPTTLSNAISVPFDTPTSSCMNILPTSELNALIRQYGTNQTRSQQCKDIQDTNLVANLTCTASNCPLPSCDVPSAVNVKGNETYDVPEPGKGAVGTLKNQTSGPPAKYNDERISVNQDSLYQHLTQNFPRMSYMPLLPQQDKGKEWNEPRYDIFDKGGEDISFMKWKDTNQTHQISNKPLSARNEGFQNMCDAVQQVFFEKIVEQSAVPNVNLGPSDYFKFSRLPNKYLRAEGEATSPQLNIHGQHPSVDVNYCSSAATLLRNPLEMLNQEEYLAFSEACRIWTPPGSVDNRVFIPCTIRKVVGIFGFNPDVERKNYNENVLLEPAIGSNKASSSSLIQHQDDNNTGNAQTLPTTETKPMGGDDEIVSLIGEVSLKSSDCESKIQNEATGVQPSADVSQPESDLDEKSQRDNEV